MIRLARGMAVLGLVLVLALAAAGCSGDGSDEDAAGATSSTSSGEVTTSSESSPTSNLVASTNSTSTTTPSSTGPSTSATTAESTTTTTDATTADPTTTNPTTTIAEPSTTEILVVEGGVHAFTSPSGNIACVLSDQSASCWISEKNWTIDEPDGPDCAISDWGNAVEVTADGAIYPCYTDFAWDPAAPAMAYGNAVELGPFRCESAETGVTCRHSSGVGFSLARAAAQLF